jgi:hypothetical protein
MAHEILLRQGWNINKKPTQRLWRDEGLRRPQRCTKCRLVGWRAHAHRIQMAVDRTTPTRTLIAG